MKIEINLENNFIDVWNVEEEKWDRYVKASSLAKNVKIKKIATEDCYTDDRFGYSINFGNITDKINEIIDIINNLES